MPKVSKEYFDDKRKIILDAALRVFSRKPAYGVNMKDIIRESKLSQGGVYKYYSNIDDIVIALLNQKNASVNPEDIIKDNYDNPEKVVFEFLEEYKNFLESSKSYGKIMFELQAIFFNDEEKLKKFVKEVNPTIKPSFWLKELFIYLDKKIEEGYFNPIFNPSDIYMQIISAINGITTELILIEYYGFDKKLYSNKGEYQRNLNIKIDKSVEMLYGTILFLLGSKKVNKYFKET